MNQPTPEARLENTVRPSRKPMELVQESRVPDQLSSLAEQLTKTTAPSASTTTPPKIEQEYVERKAWRQGVLGALNILAVVLAVRLVLLLATIGAFILALIAIRDPDPFRLGALVIYSVGIVIPCIWLSSRR